MNKQRGFTLIELLVVIAIIALLMAILMPTLNIAKRQARSAACQMNLHHWGIIWSMYCDDNDGYFCEEHRNVGWPRGNWIVALRHLYRTRSGILICPMATKRHPSGRVGGGTFNTYRMGGGGIEDRQEEASYGVNCWIYSRETHHNYPTEYFWKSKDVKGADRIPVFADTMWRGGFPREVGTPGDPPEYEGQWISWPQEMHHFCIDRHNGFINHLFMDWSVRKVGLKELWTLKWHRNFDTSGVWTGAGGVRPTDWPEWMRSFKDY